MARREEEIDVEIAGAEARLAALASETEAVRRRLDALEAERAAAAVAAAPLLAPASGRPAPGSTAGKIRLFRALFRGREDVFPRHWENAKNGRSGYSPACRNEWKRGLCQKVPAGGARPKFTCGDCAHQAFPPVSDEEIEKHLRGVQVMGVYPLLADETCRFLAADFDKKSWRQDVTAFLQTCAAHGVPAALERSRSGNGAHVWVFFSDAVPAAAARRMGAFLLTETMGQRHELGMESYDRLFPNQDTLPRGGFGNLIALPLQRAARDAGNTLFLDAAFEPFPDQWAYLAGLRTMAAAEVAALADRAARAGRVIGLRLPDAEGDAPVPPRARQARRHPPRVEIDGPLPRQVAAVLAQRLSIDTSGLPSPLLNQLKRLAAFQNPAFYARQNARLSTARTPRVISSAEEREGRLTLPRGCLEDARAALADHGIELTVEERREIGAPLALTFQGTLTPVQERAVRALLPHDIGVIVAPPGTGKTVAGAWLAAARARSTLVLVHRRPLLEQWVAQLALFLGLKAKKIGRIGGGKSKPTGILDVAMIQSLIRGKRVDDLVAGYGHVIVDECHHVSAASFERVLGAVRARFVTGLTATPQRRDGHQPIAAMQLGPVRFTVSAREQAARRSFAHRLVVRETGFAAGADAAAAGIQGLYAALTADAVRNDLIFDDVLRALEQGRSPIVLTERLDHLEHFAARLGRFARNLIVLHGRMKTRERREAMARLAAVPEGEERLLLATGRFVGEGFDDARLDTLFLALPVAWRGTIVQYAGRLHRLHPEKREVWIHDFVDGGVPVLARMFEKRLRGYRALGYEADADPAAAGAGVEETYLVAERGIPPAVDDFG